MCTLLPGRQFCDVTLNPQRSVVIRSEADLWPEQSCPICGYICWNSARASTVFIFEQWCIGPTRKVELNEHLAILADKTHTKFKDRFTIFDPIINQSVHRMVNKKACSRVQITVTYYRMVMGIVEPFQHGLGLSVGCCVKTSLNWRWFQAK